jgi:hypothetical protein
LGEAIVFIAMEVMVVAAATAAAASSCLLLAYRFVPSGDGWEGKGEVVTIGVIGVRGTDEFVSEEVYEAEPLMPLGLLPTPVAVLPVSMMGGRLGRAANLDPTVGA